MTPESIALLTASILGSTGLISAGVKFSRASRLRTDIAGTKNSVEGLDPKSSAYTAMQVSISVMTLELASYSLVRVPARRRVTLVLAFILAVLLFAMAIFFLSVTKSSSWTEVSRDDLSWSLFFPSFGSWGMTFSLVLYAGSVVGAWATAMALQTAYYRERFVAEAFHRDTIDYEMLVTHSHQLRHRNGGMHEKNGGPDFGALRHSIPKSANPPRAGFWQRVRTRLSSK